MHVVGGGCIMDKHENVVVEEEAIKVVWKEYYEAVK